MLGNRRDEFFEGAPKSMKLNQKFVFIRMKCKNLHILYKSLIFPNIFWLKIGQGGVCLLY